MTPLPPDLAVEVPPLTDDDLDALADAMTTAAEDRGAIVSLAELLDRVPVTEARVPAAHLVPDAVRRWSITDPGAAEWAMRKLAALRAESDRLLGQHDEWVERIGEWYRHEVAPLWNREAFFEHHLMEWALAERERTGKATIVLPSGAVPTVHHKARVVVEDDAALRAWIEATYPPTVCDQLIKTEESVRVGEIRKLLSMAEVGEGENVLVKVVDTEGEVVPGVGVEPAHVSATVRPVT